MIIGVVGFAGSGKSTVADILVSDYEFKKLAFADGVKDSVSVIFGWPRHLLEGDTQESREFREKIDPWWTEAFGYDVTPRHMLQMMGTEAGRDVFHKDIWLNVLAAKVKNYKNVVVSDVRFQNEVKFIQKSGGFVIRVKRGREPEWYEAAYTQNRYGTFEMDNKYPDIHLSEWAWIGTEFNAVLDNNSTIDALKALLNYQMKVFQGPKETQNKGS